MGTTQWISNGSGDKFWDDASSWSAGTPGTGDDAIVGVTGGYTVTIRHGQSANSLTINNNDNVAISNSGTLAGSLSIGSFISIDSGSDLSLRDAVLGVAGDVANNGGVDIDTSVDGVGGSVVSIGGALSNSGIVNVVCGANATTTTLTVAQLNNSGRINVGGGIPQPGGANAVLDVLAAAPLTLTGQIGVRSSRQVVNGQTLIAAGTLEYASGQIGTIGAGATLTIGGQDARIADAGNLDSNSALTGLTSNLGDFNIGNYATINLSGDLASSGGINIDTGFGDSGSTVGITGTLTNTGHINVTGNTTGSTIPTSTLTVGGLNNTGRITLGGGGDGTANSLLDDLAAAPTTLTGQIGVASARWVLNGSTVVGAGILEFASGQIGTIGAGASVGITGRDARIADAGNLGSNSALTGLTSNLGDFNIGNYATVALNGGLASSGGINIDTGYGDVGSTLSIAGALTNNGNINISGNTTTSTIPTSTLTVGGLYNGGRITLGGGNANAVLTVGGNVLNSGALTINASAVLTAGGFYNETAGSILVAGKLTVPTIEIGGGTLELAIGGAISGGITFIGPSSGRLRIDGTTIPGNTVANFVPGDTIDLPDIAFSSGGSTTLNASHQLQVVENGIPFTIAFDPNLSFVGESFHLSADASGGTQLTVAKATKPADFDGNGNSDVLWRNNASGDTGFWAIANNHISGWTGLGQSPTTYSIVGVGDFGGDGTSDVLWRNPTTGDTGYWTISNNAISAWVGLGQAPLAYGVVGVGDFNADGTADVLWRNPSNGDTGYWRIGSNTIAGWTGLGQAPTTFSVVGVGDFNGDGTADVLWRNPTTGDAGYWTIVNNQIAGWVGLGQSPTTYSVVGVGDFNRDGDADVLWRNPTTGDTGYWTIANNQISGWTDLGQAPTTYNLVGVGDFNGDGISDILWRNPTSGDTGYWTIANNQISGWTDLGQAPTTYTIENGATSTGAEGNALEPSSAPDNAAFGFADISLPVASPGAAMPINRGQIAVAGATGAVAATVLDPALYPTTRH